MMGRDEGPIRMALSREDDVGGSKPFVFEGMCCNLQSTVEGHFFQDIVDVAFYGEDREVKPQGDFFITHSRE
jgi:hypothetical protein